jgi:methyl-accepting chemotaxis protein
MTSEDIKLLITISAFFITLGGLIWKMSALNSQVKENTKDLNSLGTKVFEIMERQTHDMTELKANIGSIEQSIVRIDTSMDFISESIKELKNE